ncbi:glycosyltransferase family 2 protein [Sphingobium nicotianae]|uniref:Glycosyltransferase family 2 protein n=1 Tax=Sphingobium nicotianae TaxID=2782607 RepID=A0A9X1DF55_9SPHN|nr:glycosyltransferase family 2 protein [Sphingobium nicotianae]MBT2188921.1 glycosyltransferase family 2 protein [Sphingobium nicotianae]
MADLPNPSLAIVTVNYRTADFAIRCVEALAEERATAGPFEVVVVDGDSGDGSAEALAGHFAAESFRDWVSVLPLDLNGGFGWANNQAMLRLLQRADPPEFIHLLNPDTVVEPGAIKALLDPIRADPKLGAACSRLLEPDGTLAGSAFRFPSVGREFVRGCGLAKLGRLLGIKPDLVEEAGPAEWLTGASVMFRSAALRESGLFDDGFFLYFEEVELMHRMGGMGWTFRFAPESRVTHIAGAATGVASGKQVAVRPYPAYRFEARRRFFVLVYGRGGLILANIAWLAGRALALMLRPLRGRRADAIPREVSMTLEHGFWPRARDSRRSIPRWDEPPGRAPAWTLP